MLKKIRNLKFFEIYTFKDGKKIEPDFIILSKLKNGESANMQIFIEPKGSHLLQKDSEILKEEFLQNINTKFEGNIIKSLGFFNSDLQQKLDFSNTDGQLQQKSRLEIFTANFEKIFELASVK